MKHTQPDPLPQCDRIARYVNASRTHWSIYPVVAGTEPTGMISVCGETRTLVDCLPIDGPQTDDAILEAVRCADEAGELVDLIADGLRGAA